MKCEQEEWSSGSEEEEEDEEEEEEKFYDNITVEAFKFECEDDPLEFRVDDIKEEIKTEPLF